MAYGSTTSTRPCRTRTRTRIRIREATTAADVAAAVDIHFAAFGPNVMSRLMYPGGESADARAKFAAGLAPPGAGGDAGAEKDGAGTGTTTAAAAGKRTILVVAELVAEEGEEGEEEGEGDERDAEIVAFSKWVVESGGRPEEEWSADPPLTTEMLGEGVDLEVFDRFIGGMRRMRKAWVKGDAALELAILACKPTRTRLGAGSALVQWGIEMADREGLNTWLEATPAGYPLYGRFGFEDLDVQDLPISDLYGVVRREDENWGAGNAVALVGHAPEGVHRCVLMRRVPKRKA